MPKYAFSKSFFSLPPYYTDNVKIHFSTSLLNILFLFSVKSFEKKEVFAQQGYNLIMNSLKSLNLQSYA